MLTLSNINKYPTSCVFGGWYYEMRWKREGPYPPYVARGVGYRSVESILIGLHDTNYKDRGISAYPNGFFLIVKDLHVALRGTPTYVELHMT
jgi:hypothetical protein